MRNYGPIDDFTLIELYPDVQVNRDNAEYSSRPYFWGFRSGS